MGGKRRAQPSGDGNAAETRGGAWRKRQTRVMSVHGAAGSAEAGSSGYDESGSILSPVTMCFSMRCGPTALVGRKAALEAAVEAALRSVVSEFGGREVRVEWTRVGPSKDTLQRVLPLVLERVGPAGGLQCFLVCKSWRRELEARGFCSKTVHLCSTLAGGRDAERLGKNVQQRLDASSGDAERAMCLDANAFLQRARGWKGSLPEWLQAASQEPDASFLSRGAASTAQALGLPLVRWVGKPQGGGPGSHTLMGHADAVYSVAISADGKRVVTGSMNKLVKIWDVSTGDEVSLSHTMY